MRKLLTTLTCATAAIAIMAPIASAKVKKNDPDKRDVLKLMEELGAPHYVEKMKMYDLGTLKFEDDAGEDIYYHVYTAALKKEGYRVLVYDNTPTYMGYFAVDYEPVDNDDENVLLEAEDTNDEGDSLYFKIEFTKEGPPAKIRLGTSASVEFVKNPRLKEEKKNVLEGGLIPVVPKETSSSGEVIDYRDWNITVKGRTVTVNALFVKFEKGNVTIKNAKNGKEAVIPGSALSEEDKAYVKRITAK